MNRGCNGDSNNSCGGTNTTDSTPSCWMHRPSCSSGSNDNREPTRPHTTPGGSLMYLLKLKATLTATLAFVAFGGVDVYAWGGLQSQSINGFSRYCTYSDGGVLTVGSTELCPINNSGAFQNHGSPSSTITIENRNAGFGSLTGQRVQGFNRYCSYSDGAVSTVGSTDLCPVTDK